MIINLPWVSWNSTWELVPVCTSFRSFITQTTHYRQYCFVGDKTRDCKLGEFHDTSFTGDLQDSKSTSDAVLCVFGQQTPVAISWMCKKEKRIFSLHCRIWNNVIERRFEDGRHTSIRIVTSGITMFSHILMSREIFGAQGTGIILFLYFIIYHSVCSWWSILFLIIFSFISDDWLKLFFRLSSVLRFFSSHVSCFTCCLNHFRYLLKFIIQSSVKLAYSILFSTNDFEIILKTWIFFSKSCIVLEHIEI